MKWALQIRAFAIVSSFQSVRLIACNHNALRSSSKGVLVDGILWKWMSLDCPCLFLQPMAQQDILHSSFQNVFGCAHKTGFRCLFPLRRSQVTLRQAALRAQFWPTSTIKKTHEEERLHSRHSRKGESAVAFERIVNVYQERLFTRSPILIKINKYNNQLLKKPID